MITMKARVHELIFNIQFCKCISIAYKLESAGLGLVTVQK